MAKDRDEYDAQALHAEVAQMRAELAMARAQVQRFEETQKETEQQKKAFADFLAWVALTAEQKTQLEADKRFAGVQGETWEVNLQEHPTVRLPAHSDYEAIGRYNEICGITGTAHKHTCTQLQKVA